MSQIKSTTNEFSSLLILDEDKYVEHIYNRYNRVYVEGLIAALNILKLSKNIDTAKQNLINSIHIRMFKASDNIADINGVLNGTLKRGNPRRKSRIGL